MSIRTDISEDDYVHTLVENTCAKIKAKFPDATFDVCPHPSQRGAVIDAHVPTDDDFDVLDLVNPELDDLLVKEDIAIYVRAVGRKSQPRAIQFLLPTKMNGAQKYGAPFLPRIGGCASEGKLIAGRRRKAQ
jgi:hypothetical protein